MTLRELLSPSTQVHALYISHSVPRGTVQPRGGGFVINEIDYYQLFRNDFGSYVELGVSGHYLNEEE